MVLCFVLILGVQKLEKDLGFTVVREIVYPAAEDE